MVKIGDKIKVNNKLEGKVTNILKGEDGRYVIFFKDRKNPHYFTEGDEDFKVVK